METPTRRTATWPWALAATLAALAGTLVLSAAASTVAEAWPPLPAAIGVAVGSLLLAAGLPLGLAWFVIGRMRDRGMTVKVPQVAAGLVVALDILWIVLVQVGGPAPLVQLMPDRGTWLLDALSGRGPFGPAAVPVVARRAEETRTERSPDALVDALCDRSARALAGGVLVELRGDDTEIPGLRRLAEHHGMVAAEGEDPLPMPLPESLGRAFLVDTLDLMAGSLPLVDLPEGPTVDLVPGTPERTRVPLGAEGWEGVYEDGAWRTCAGPDEAVAERGRTLVRMARAQVRAAKVVDLPPAWDGPVRDALRTAIAGRSGFALGVPPASGWSDAFTGAGAAAQAGRVLAWCVPAAVDPARVPAIEELRTRWALPEGTLDASSTTGLAASGRELLADVATACAPVAQDRVATELASGIPATVEDRRRWAALDASTVDRAVLTELSPGEIRAEIAGAVVRVLDEGGSWHVDWR
ncbi:MAG: hypothetical protein H6735_13835 [Alphaproteobacteria bacterium]|nr:hypothetical protein [Alphaproteobacteria bacterium]